MSLNSKTKTVCLLGHPVKHSFSPIMHNYLFEKYNINNIYVCFDVEPTKLKESVYGIKALGMKGLNVTIPHKVEIMEYLDYIDENAKLIGAVNTIKNNEGNLEGYNTDGRGFVKSIINQNYILENKRVMILGSGGACRSIAIELCLNNIKSIEIRNRSIEKAQTIIETIDKNFKVKGICSSEEVGQTDLDNIDIIINTTPIGMENNDCPINKNLRINNNVLVCDIVYNPHNTEFINWAMQQNIKVIYGIDMLINQGLEAFYIWTGINPTIKDEEEIKKLYSEYIK
ncbi:MAG: shikimate dehydrogenase [Romboutsia sp.]